MKDEKKDGQGRKEGRIHLRTNETGVSLVCSVHCLVPRCTPGKSTSAMMRALALDDFPGVQRATRQCITAQAHSTK
jgi:hypothetical protein